MLEQHSCHDGQEGNYRTTQASAFLHNHILCVIIIVILVAVIFPVSLTVRKERQVSSVHVPYACPPMWIGFGDKCFYFSEDTVNWTFSQDFCKALEADLVQIDTQEELKVWCFVTSPSTRLWIRTPHSCVSSGQRQMKNFLTRYKGPYDHWIGLSRESPSHSWKWTNNTTGNFVFTVRGSGECAYLSDNGVSTGKVYSDRRWICSKPISPLCSCQIT